MKILMLSQDFLPNVGGITSHIVYLSKALVARGHEVLVLKPGQDAYHEWRHPYGFSVMHLKKKPTLFLERFFIRKKIAELCNTQGFDLVHWHQLTGYETKWLPTIPKIFTNHTSMYLEQYERSLGKMKLKLMLNHVDAIISPSQELQEKSAFIAPRHGNAYIANGVDEQKFNPVSVDSSASVDRLDTIRALKQSGASIILCPRRLEPKCGVEYLIRAVPLVVKKIPNAFFVIAGRGGYVEEEKRLKQWTIDNGVQSQVFFLGDVANDAMPMLYTLADVVAFPSLMEATSISCLEAMASGKAIVSTDVGGLAQLIIDYETGLLVKPRDEVMLAHKLCELLEDCTLGNRLGANARRMVEEHFTWSRIAQQTEAIYKKVLVDGYKNFGH
jgi:glycosyltransferase involved in cell wall biosynthesis